MSRYPLLWTSIKSKDTDKLLPACSSSFPLVLPGGTWVREEANQGNQPWGAAGSSQFSSCPSCLLQPKPLSANRNVGTSVLLYQDPLGLWSELCTVSREWPQWNHTGLEKASMANKLSRKQQYENELLPGSWEQFSEQEGNIGKVDDKKKYWVC